MPTTAPDDTLLEFPCFNLYLGWRRAQAYYKPLMEPGMNPQRTYVMEMLHAAPRAGRKVTELARALDLDAGTISGLLSRMEREGLVERRRSTTNRAEVRVVLTRSGRAKWNKIHARLAAADRRLVRALGKERLAALQETVAILGELTDEE